MSYYLFDLNKHFLFIDWHYCFYYFSYLFFRLDKVILFFIFEFDTVERFSTEQRDKNTLQI